MGHHTPPGLPKSCCNKIERLSDSLRPLPPPPPPCRVVGGCTKPSPPPFNGLKSIEEPPSYPFVYVILVVCVLCWIVFYGIDMFYVCGEQLCINK